MIASTRKSLIMVALVAATSIHSIGAQDEAPKSKPKASMVKVPVPEDVSAVPADAEKSKSGLAWKQLQEGTGERMPLATDTVTVHYSGWTTDGKMFDSSVERGEPTSFPLNGVIGGWTEGLQLMVEGEKRRFWIPADLAYGEKPSGGRPGGLLVFDVELISIKDAPKPPEDTEKTAGGTAYKILTAGENATKPTADQLVTFHFVGKTMEGQMVQDTKTQSSPMTLALDAKGVPPELTENLADMAAGESRRVWLPESRIPGGFLVADLDLISFKDAPPAPPVPSDVGDVPEDAEKTSSGLAYKVLEKGTGKTNPGATDTVKVHYSGWTTNGELFDSSVARGEPTQFPLNGVIPGWTEGVQLMVVGQKNRFWIPAELAYGENPGGGQPSGMLVFDIELLEIGK